MSLKHTIFVLQNDRIMSKVKILKKGNNAEELNTELFSRSEMEKRLNDLFCDAMAEIQQYLGDVNVVNPALFNGEVAKKISDVISEYHFGFM